MSMRSLLAAMALVFLAWGCGGSGGYSSMTTSMTPTTTSTSASASTVTIVGQKNAQSFDPNPAPIPQGSLVVWRNLDTTPHHIVMNDGSYDSGSIAPGASSPALRLNSTGGNYHCTVHPTTMFGSINVATMETSPSPGY